jgi:spore coat polysaccharide biosynthesis protein SpsF
MSRVVAVVQARLGSSRLPGKALALLAGKPMFHHIVERLRTCATVHDLILATTDDPADEALVECAGALGVRTYRGSVDDVLDRMVGAGRSAGADVMVRVTGDDPFKDPEVTDLAVLRLLEDGAEYVSNTLVPTYPEGVDIEVVTMDALGRAWSEAQLHSEREHVTPYIWKQPDRFRLVNITHTTDLSSMRWTVDYPEDLAFARAVYDELYHGAVFGMRQVLDLLARRPELALLNQGIVRNAGYVRSLETDHLVD